MSSTPSEADAESASNSAIYPTFEDVQQSGVAIKCTPEVFRFQKNWLLRPRWQDTFVREDDTWLGPVKPYFDSETDTLHEIASVAVCEPKVSAVTVYQYELGNVEEEFQIAHLSCDADDWGDPRDVNPELIQYEIPPGYDINDPNRVHKMSLKKLRCCEETRPVNQSVSVTVRASMSGKGYVTIHDYITTIHPWLLSLSGLILPAYASIHQLIDPVSPIDPEDLEVNWFTINEVSLQPRLKLERAIYNGQGYGQKPEDFDEQNTSGGSSTNRTNIYHIRVRRE